LIKICVVTFFSQGMPGQATQVVEREN